MAAAVRRDAVIVAACVSCLLLLSFGFKTIGRAMSAAGWFTAGVSAWSWAFTVSGRLKTRDPVLDNVRVVRHQSFVISVLCFGTALVGVLEAVVAYHVHPWWLQVLANAGFTLVSFMLGCHIFGFSHEWVLRDPNLEKPLFMLDVCVIS